MSVVYNLAVKIGEYESHGEKKNRYQRIGRIMDGPNGQFVLLYALFISNQLNGLANKDRRDSIIVSMFTADEKPAQNQDNISSTESDIPF